MKKVVSFIIMFFIFTIGVNAETTDIEGPILNSYSFNKFSFNVGDEVEATIDAYDEISNISMIEFVFVNTASENNDLNSIIHLGFNNIDVGSKLYKSNSIPVLSKAGEYKLLRVDLFDTTWNKSCYKPNSGLVDNTVCKEGYQNVTLNIAGSNNKYPEVEKLNISKQSIEINDTVDFEIKLSSNEHVKNVFLFYSKTIYVELSLNDKNTYSASKKINKTGNIQFNNLLIQMDDGVEVRYFYTNDTTGSSNAIIHKVFEVGKNDINVSGELDITPPSFYGIKLDKTSYTAPTIVTLKLDVADDIPNNIESIQIDTYNEANPKSSLGFLCTGKDHDYTCKLELNQYVLLGRYYIKNVILYDNSSNFSIYTTSETEASNQGGTASDGNVYKYFKMNEYSFNLEKNVNSDATTSTKSQKIIDVINKASDEHIISIDSSYSNIVSKDVFEAIKGTNKTISIESNGIQWIFNGKDIKEPKDINVYVDIRTNNKDKDDSAISNVSSIVINFARNGVLPGIAKVRIKAEYTFRNFIGQKDLYVYYYNENDNSLEPIAEKIEMTDDGYYEFYIKHNSTYIISNTKPETKYIAKASTEELKINEKKIIEESEKGEETEEPILPNGKAEPEKKVIIVENEKEDNKEEKFNLRYLYLIIPIALLIVIFTALIILKKKNMWFFKEREGGKENEKTI